MSRALRIGGLITAGLMIGAATTEIATGSIPAANGVIHACYSTNTNPVGRLRVIDTGAGQSCTVGEVALNWNQSAFNFRGAWSSSATYAVGDVVTNAGSSYLALVANTATSPSGHPSTWAVLATKGSPGKQGPQGVPGIQGPPGPAGPANLQLLFSNGGVSLGLASQHCAIVSLGAHGILPGDTGIVAFDAGKWPAGLIVMPLRATAPNVLPADVCNPTSSSVSVSSVSVSVWRVAGS